ncbi:hypothetical protein DENSPDRAFT_932736, partial [Dentipellis sp. KUC8613]
MQKVLFWIETMNLLGRKEGCNAAIRTVEKQLMEYDIFNDHHDLQLIITAVQDLITAFIQTLASLSTPHLYISCLPTEFTTSSVPDQWKESFTKVPNIQCIG